jgi:hypothetical protein
VVDGDAALGQQLLHVAVGQAVAQVPAIATVINSGGEPEPANADRSTFGRWLEVDAPAQLPQPPPTLTHRLGRTQQSPAERGLAPVFQ